MSSLISVSSIVEDKSACIVTSDCVDIVCSVLRLLVESAARLRLSLGAAARRGRRARLMSNGGNTRTLYCTLLDCTILVCSPCLTDRLYVLAILDSLRCCLLSYTLHAFEDTVQV